MKFNKWLLSVVAAMVLGTCFSAGVAAANHSSSTSFAVPEIKNTELATDEKAFYRCMEGINHGCNCCNTYDDQASDYGLGGLISTYRIETGYDGHSPVYREEKKCDLVTGSVWPDGTAK